MPDKKIAELIDVRETPAGKVADVRIAGCTLPFSMPYDEFCKVENALELQRELYDKYTPLVPLGSQRPELQTIPIDPRVKQQNDILYALIEEPVAKEQADALIDELAELDADLQRKPPEVVEFGSAEWFDRIEEIPF